MVTTPVPSVSVGDFWTAISPYLVSFLKPFKFVILFPPLIVIGLSSAGVKFVVLHAFMLQQSVGGNSPERFIETIFPSSGTGLI